MTQSNVISATRVKELTGIQNLIPNGLFERSINPIFRKYFKEILGDYFNPLWAKLMNSLNMNASDQELIDQLELSLAHYVLSENVMNFSINFTKAGIVNVNNNEYTNIPLTELHVIKQNYFNTANDLRTIFIDWFNENRSQNEKVSKNVNKRLGGFVVPRKTWRWNYPSDYFGDYCFNR